jgi:hypothetical protein
MATVTKRGKACVEGIPGTIDLVVYPVKQTGKMVANFEEEVVKDEDGFDVAWVARNLHFLNDFAFKLLGDTQAHAIAGGAFIAPYATVTFSGFDLAAFNGTYQNISGQDIDLANTKVGDMSIKLRRYDDATQNTLSQTVPA